MIIQGYHPRIGGAERQVGALAPLLQQLNVGVTVLTRRYPGLEPSAVIDGVPVFRLPIPGPVPLAALTFTAAALPLLGRLRPDVIHAHELFSPATTALAAKRLYGTPIVATAHRSGPLGDVERMKNRPFGQRRLRAIRAEVDAFTAISHEVALELQGLGVEPARCFNIANGVDTSLFQPVDAATKARLRRELELPDGPLVIFAGRLAPEKRVGNLLDVWPRLLARFPAAHLLILGTGPEEARLQEQGGQHVHFGGAVQQVAPYLQAADIWVLPSAAEGFSVAMLEALATGLPVVLTDVGGARDAIVDTVNGLLIPPDDLTALEHALDRLLADPDLCLRLGQAGRARVEQEYALPIIAARLRDLYADLARRNT